MSKGTAKSVPDAERANTIWPRGAETFEENLVLFGVRREKRDLPVVVSADREKNPPFVRENVGVEVARLVCTQSRHGLRCPSHRRNAPKRGLGGAKEDVPPLGPG